MVVLSAHAKVVNGLFGVPKDQDSLRLIIDARPANAAFIEPPHVDLPTPDLFAQLQSSDEPLYVAKVDLDNFYHRLRIPVWMQQYFALPPVPAAAFGLPGGLPVLAVPPCRWGSLTQCFLLSSVMNIFSIHTQHCSLPIASQHTPTSSSTALGTQLTLTTASSSALTPFTSVRSSSSIYM